MRLETHIHTKYSQDSLLCFWILYAKCRMKKIDYVAITEHNNVDGAHAFKQYCEKRGNKVRVIIGEEIMTDSGEVIGLYLTKQIQQGLSVSDTIEAIHSQNGIVYIPHPYDEKRKKTVLRETEIAAHKEQIDYIECHNGRNISTEYTAKQTEIAEKYGLTKVVGSDAHTFLELGRNYMEIDIEPCDAEHFRTAIAVARLHKANRIKISHTLTKLARVIHLVKRGKWDELYRAIYRAATK